MRRRLSVSCSLGDAICLEMNAELREMATVMSEYGKSFNRDPRGGIAWHIAKSEALQIWHRSRQVRDHIVVDH